MKHSFKDWVVATRPWSFPASAMPVLVTIAWCWAQGTAFNGWLALWALVNIIFVHAAGNVWSDIADYRSGVDAKDTFGVQLLVNGDFTPQEFKRLSVTLNIIAVAGGLALVALTGLPLLYIGIAGIALSLLYPHLKYHALGDLVIILCYSVLPMTGTSFIVSGAIHWPALWLAVPVGLITVAILHANNVRDIETDSRAGISTFPMLTGRQFGVCRRGPGALPVARGADDSACGALVARHRLPGHARSRQERPHDSGLQTRWQGVLCQSR